MAAYEPVCRKTKTTTIEADIAEVLLMFAGSGHRGAEVAGLAIKELPKFKQAIQKLGLDDVVVCKRDGRIFLERKMSS